MAEDIAQQVKVLVAQTWGSELIAPEYHRRPGANPGDEDGEEGRTDVT